MDKGIAEVDVGVGLSDSELVSYKYLKHNDKLEIHLLAWNGKDVQINCINPIFFVDRGCEAITMFCEKLSELNLLREVLEKNYEDGRIPENHPYKLYQLLDLDDNPCIEVICEGVEVQK